ncbi:hypothetical protein FRC01_003417 [Tulasnella sp. 417]|nr:hypothetical protein FRC01_003417 [Tulasnella sp. 417]
MQRPTTPVHSNTAPPDHSSPVTGIPRYFAEEERDQVQEFAYDEEFQLADFESWEALIDFLDHSSNEPIDLSQIPNITNWSAETYLEAANEIAKSIQASHFSGSDTLVFKNTEDTSHPEHVTDTDCRPDFIAAFEADFKGKQTPWPYIRLTGEHASKGKTRKDQEKQGMSYLHYLLLARPDLYVAQGMFTSKKDIVFLVGIGGQGVRSLTVKWSSEELSKLMYAFIFCLYRPDKFADPSYKIGHDKDNRVTYTIKLQIEAEADGVPTDQQVVLCRDFLPIYASSPFGTRTHVFSNPDSNVKINGKPLTVLKDQFCRVGTRFHEHGILEHVHTQKEVPGVVEAVYNEVISPPVSKPVEREKRRLGMGQCGEPFMTIPNIKTMLEVMFDTLEGPSSPSTT